MRKFSLTMLAVAIIAGFSSMASADDALTCFKVKDLKDGGSPIAVTPSPSALSSYGAALTANCTLSKIASVCLPSNLNGDNAVSIPNARCCFKMKCDAKSAVVPSMTLTDNTAGTTFAGKVSVLKASTVCVPCIWGA